VLDFGMAKVLEEARDLATDVGRTMAYAAPERLRSERVNVHADFWSLGVMFYEMVSGHRPYPNLEDPRLRRNLYSAITGNAPRAPLPPDCPIHLQAIIHRLLAFQPAHRYQTADEIHSDLERYVRRETPIAASYYDTPETTPVRERRAWRSWTRATSRSDGGAASGAAGSADRARARARAGARAEDCDQHRGRFTGRDPGAGTRAGAAPIAPSSRQCGRNGGPRRIVATEGLAWLFAERFPRQNSCHRRTYGDRQP
jgi:hypothetical protein